VKDDLSKTRPIGWFAPGVPFRFFRGVCRVCGKGDKDKPMCFRGEPWCSDNHRKLIVRDGDESE
jgi:hypothetical protein